MHSYRLSIIISIKEKELNLPNYKNSFATFTEISISDREVYLANFYSSVLPNFV